MRAAAILGLGCSERDLEPFKKNSSAEWLIGLPVEPAGIDAILIFGGDGTVHRHLAQLVRLRLPVLVVPRGSGNDFARALKLRGISDSLAAWKKFSSGAKNVKAIDLGVIHSADGSGAAHYFCCVGGVGLDAEVARRANRLPRWLRGHGGYVLSLPPALIGFAPFPMKIFSGNGESNELALRSDQPTVVAAFANTPMYGDGMKIAPQAVIDDGQLDVCLISDIDRFKLFCLFPTVYFGRHLDMREVDYFKAEHLLVETEHPLDVYADGEFVCRTPIEVSVAGKALHVLTAE
jgi:diacylglycerol kinase (ATP)